MSRDFSRGTDVINLGDVTGARFDADVVWSLLAMYRINNTSADDNAIVSKYASGGQQQFILRTASGTAPTELEVFLGVNQEISGNAGVIELDTWYGALVTSNGDGGFPDDNFLYNAELDGTFTDDGIGNTNWGNAGDLTADILIGARDGGSDHTDGLIANVLYVDGEVTRQEFLDWLADPEGMALYFQEVYGTQFIHALKGIDSPEPDWSGNGNDGTVTGTVRGEDPHVAMPARNSTQSYLEIAAGGGGTLTADAGSYAWTGQAAALEYNSLLSAESGSYAWTGQAANLLYNTVLSAEAGSYAWTGQAVNLLYNPLLSAESGSYAWAGQDATLTHNTGATLAADAGSYAWTGAAVNLLYDSVLSAEAGSYIWTGANVGLTHSAASIWTATTPASTSWSEESSASSTWTPKSKPSTDWTES